MGKRLYVGNLPYDADEASLRATFGQDGRTVERVHIVLDRETQRPRGFAFVEMATEEQARQAIASLDGTVLGARQLRVTEAEDRRPAGPGGPGGPGGQRGPGGPPRGDRPAGGGAPRPAGTFGGGGPRTADEPPRANRFGPDARPKGDRDSEPRRGAPRRRTEDGDGEYGGKRGHRRFEDDDDDE